MKLVRLLEIATDSIEIFINLLESNISSKGKHEPKILCVADSVKFEQLINLFSTEPDERHLKNYHINMANYLNLLLQEVAAVQPVPTTLDDQQRAVVTTPPKADFFFLAVEPSILMHNPECSTELMLKYLRLTLTELNLRKEKILFGWRVQRKDSGCFLVNYASVSDWNMFLNCVKDPKPTSTVQTIDFGENNEDPRSIPCHITAKEFGRIRETHGLSVQFETYFRNDLESLLRDNKSESIAALRTNLQQLMSSRGSDQLCQLIDVIASRVKPDMSDDEKAFYTELGIISLIYKSMKQLHQPEASKSAENQQASAPELAITLTLSVDQIRKTIGEASEPVFLDCMKECLALLQRTQTLPQLASLYDPASETVASEVLLNLEDVYQLLHKLTELLQSFERDSTKVMVFFTWLKDTSMTLFMRILGSFFNIKYHNAIIRLSFTLLNWLDLIKKALPDSNKKTLCEFTHDLKYNLINAFLSVGQFPAILHWLPYFELNCRALYTLDRYEYLLNLASDHNFLAILAQQLNDLSLSRIHFDNAWKCLTKVVQAAPIPTDVRPEVFYQSIKEVIDSLVSGYKMLASELFELGEFVEAKSIFSKVSVEAVSDLMIDLKNRAFATGNQVFVKAKTKNPKSGTLTSDIEINERWCDIAHLISIKRCLSRHLPQHCELQTENEKLVLTSSVKEFSIKFRKQLTDHNIKHRTESKKLILDDLQTISLRTLSTMFSAKNGHKPAIENTKAVAPAKPQFSLASCATLESSPSELLEFRVLKAMQFKSYLYMNKEYLSNISGYLAAFYGRCTDPLLKMRSTGLIVSVNLQACFLVWKMADGTDHAAFLRTAKDQLEEGRQFASQSFKLGSPEQAQSAQAKEGSKTLENNPEVQQILEQAQRKIEQYESIISEYLPVELVAKVKNHLASLESLRTKFPEYIYTLLLGATGILEHYQELSSQRNSLRTTSESRTLSVDTSTYNLAPKLVGAASIVCFVLAYELLTQESLNQLEDNNRTIALDRIRKEYDLLLELKKSMDLVWSSDIESMLLVVRTKLEPSLSIEEKLALLDQALKKVKKTTNPIYIASFHLIRIDTVISEKHTNPFAIIRPFLSALLELMKKCQHNITSANESNIAYLAHIICSYIFQYLCLPQEQLLRFDAEALEQSVSQLLSIIDYVLNTLLAKINNSTYHRLIKELCDQSQQLLTHGSTILRAMPLELQVRDDLAPTKRNPKIVRLLIPKVLLSQVNLKDMPYDQTDPFIPMHPLIPLVLSCGEMQQYNADNEQLGTRFDPELSKVYSLVCNSTKTWLHNLLPPQLISALNSSEDQQDWFERLIDLVGCLSNAHTAPVKKIELVHCAVIRRMLAVYPTNGNLLFTVYSALADNTPLTMVCPELEEACLNAAKAGHTIAQYCYAKLLQTGNYGVKVNEALAKRYLLRLAEEGYYKAEIRLAKLHKQGLFGYPQDSEAAQMYAKKARDNPDTPDEKNDKLDDIYDLIFTPIQDFYEL